MTSLKKLQNGSDIRGIAISTEKAPANLTAGEAKALTLGFIRHLETKTGKPAKELRVAVGRDSRITGPYLAAVLQRTFEEAGLTCLNASLASTPAMFMSTVFEETACDGAVMITASHLPYERNGFKYFDKDGGLQKEDIAAIIGEAEKVYAPAKDGKEPDLGEETVFPLMERYAAHLREIISGGAGDLSGLHIVVDAGNGAGGFFATEVLAPLGCDITGSRFLDPDGTFPNHVPNPENKEAMAAIQEAVLTNRADLGLIFDTDVDRSAAVTASGRSVARNGIVALAASLIAEDHPKATVVTDSITSTQLTDYLEGHLGLTHLRFKRGYKNVINKAQELTAEGIDCPLAIETSGHCALSENYFLDDGAYLAAKIVIKTAALIRAGSSLDDLLAELEEPAEAAEVRMAITAEDFSSLGDHVLAAMEEWVSSAASLPLALSLVTPNYEGVRADFFRPGETAPLGWCLLRKSLHDPIMPLNLEANEPGGVSEIAALLLPFLSGFPGLDAEGLKDLI